MCARCVAEALFEREQHWIQRGHRFFKNGELISTAMDFQAFKFSIFQRFLDLVCHVIEVKKCCFGVYIGFPAKRSCSGKRESIIQAAFFLGCFCDELIANFPKLIFAAWLDRKVRMDRDGMISHLDSDV